MMQEVVRSLETGPMAEIGVIAFFIAFLLISARAFLMSKQDRDDMKQMPLDDREEERPFLTQQGQVA